MVQTEPLQCAKCLAALPPELHEHPGDCLRCGLPVETHIFPALGKPLGGSTQAQTVLVEGESNCFYHEANSAAAVCDACGRFLCGLCDIELGSRHVCPACLSSGQQTGRVHNLEGSRALWGQIALAVAVLPILFYPFLIFTAPTALFLSIYGWRKPGSLVRGGKTRLVLAMIIALLEIAGIVTAAVFFIRSFQDGR